VIDGIRPLGTQSRSEQWGERRFYFVAKRDNWMELLWSPAVATGRNRWQMERRRRRLRQAKTVAMGCDQLPESFHGKEGVDGSSPSEGFAKALDTAPFLCSPLPNEAASRPFWKADGKSDAPGTIEA
jgi:hypothetical protein